MNARLKCAALAFAVAAGCGTPPGGGDQGAEDSGTPATTDAGSTPDGGSAVDAGMPGNGDGGSTPDSGGSGTDAGGGGDGGAPVTCPGPFVLCEDFENGLNTSLWTVQGTAPTIDGTMAHRGSHSVHFSVDNTMLRTGKPFPALSHDLWARVFVYMDQLPPGSTTVPQGPNSSFSWSAGNAGDTRVGFRHTRVSGGYNFPGYDFTNTDNAVWPLDQWVCVEWHYQSVPDGGTNPDAGMGTQDYWVDGVYRPLMHFGPHPMPAFTYFWIGELYFGLDTDAGAGVPYDIWLDDLVLDTKQVGCTQ